MMTLLAFVATIAAIVGIARYNESDKLFWQLLIAFVGSYAAASVVYNIAEDKKQDNVVMINEAPTQVLGTIPSLDEILAGNEFSATKREKSPKPVGKDSLVSQTVILSKVHASPRGQPNWSMFFDDS
jgi:hypothetical protein